MGYVPRMNFGTEDIVRGSHILIQMGNASRIVEILAESKSATIVTLDSTSLVQIEAYYVNPNDNSSSILVEPLLIDEETYSQEGMVLYRFNLTSGSAQEDAYDRIIRLNTTQKLTWFELGTAYSNDRFYVSKPNNVITSMQFFLGAITYPAFFVWAVLLLLVSVIYWFIKEKGKKNMAVMGEVEKKRFRQIVLIVFGSVLCAFGVAFAIVVPFFTRRETNDVCCVYFTRRFNSNQTPVQNYGNNCKYVSFLNEKQKLQDYKNNCFAQESYTIKYQAHIWWWLLLCGTIPGLILYTVGHIGITVGVYKLLRLVKKQHVAQGVTKFQVGFQ